MSVPNPTALLEQLASLVLSVDADEAGLDSLLHALTELYDALEPVGGPALDTASKAITHFKELRAIAPREVLQLVSAAAVSLQLELTPSASNAAAKAVTRDQDTLELVRDFLQESGDGISVADEILLNIESAGTTSEKVNALFRVFHSIKGVAGFLELTEIVALAHSTESLMNEVRDGRCSLTGDALELVFKATTMLRAMLDDLKRACEAGVELGSHPDCESLVTRLNEFLAGLPPEGEPAAVVAPVVVAPVPSGAPLVAAIAAPRASAPEPEPQFEKLESAAPSPSAPRPAGKMRETVKVDLERVDSMVEMIGELIIVESMLKHSREPGSTSVTMRNTLGQLGKISRDLQNAAMRMRTVPVNNAFQKMARLTREVGRKAGKEVVLVTQGEGTEMDRAMVERLEDPLVHMVRNAVDHGIESPAERLAAGKQPGGVLTLTASHQGGSIVIELKDDGKGLDRDRILKKGIERGLVSNPEALTEQEIFQLIFAPGFSTAPKVTDLSGRGVGMDVVKRNVEAMRGRVFIESRPGAGSTFRLVLPLTLAIIDGMLVTVGRERYLVPSLSIVEALQPTAAMLMTIGERDELLSVRGQVLPMLRLSSLLGVAGARKDPTTALVVVVESMGKRVGLLVDEVLAQQQVVIKALGQGVGKAEFYSGAAILSDGNVGLILNIDKLCGLISYKHRAATGAQHEARP
ncbi:MAG: chemotaxis protein CheA [Archangium sp.]|nr:chemotaxis protein CheA [Archangium sp.]